MKRLQIMVSIDGSVKHCSFWNICNIYRVLSARAVGRAWTGNSRTDSPSNRFYASLATRMFPLPWIKTVFFFCILTIAPLLIVENVAPLFILLIYCHLVSSQLFFNHWWPLSFALLQPSSMPADNRLGGHGDMWSHCFPVLWMQHIRIIFDFNALDMMQIFKSIPMVVNWYKTEIGQYFYKWCFFYIYYQIENMNRKGIMWVKASEGTAMPCGFTRHPQHGMGKFTIKVL